MFIAKSLTITQHMELEPLCSAVTTLRWRATALFYFVYNPGKTAVLTVLPLLSALCYTAQLSSDRVRTLGTHFALMKMTEADP